MRTYNDPAKQLSRVKLREFIEKHLLPYKRAEKLRVVCFPGAEVEGEEALEVKEVYDLLGIPRKNIVGLERNKDIAARLRAANLGIEVVDRDAHDFFSEDPRMFDIIMLDYKGQRTWKERDTTRFIAGRSLLESQGIFGSAHIAQRESEQMQTSLSLLHHQGIINKYVGSWVNATRSLFKKGLATTLPLEIPDIPDAPLDEMRTSAITDDTLACFNNGSYELHPEAGIFVCVDAAQRYHQDMDRVLFPTDSRILRAARKALGLAAEAGLDGDPAYRLARMTERYGGSYLAKAMEEKGMHIANARLLLQTLSMIAHHGYCANEVVRYEYTSNKGNVMQMNLFSFKQFPEGLASRVQRMIRMDSEEKRIHFNLRGETLERYFMKTAILCKELAPIVRQNHLIKEVVTLGSIHSTQESALYEPSIAEKAKIYEGIRRGITDEQEFCKKHQIAERQLSSYKAWVTMHEKQAIAAMEELK